MTTIREILEQSGLDTYTINSLDPQVTGALQNVLAKAEQDKMSVDQFWTNVYNPGVSQWEQDRQEMGRKIARAEAEKAALLAERNALKESGLVTDDLPISVAQPRNSGGQNVTPGTPSFDPNDVVSRAGQGLAMLADIEWKHRNVFGKPMGIPPSQLVAEADRQGISLAEAAERKFAFPRKSRSRGKQEIRADERSKIASHYSDGQSGSFNPMAANNSMSAIRRAAQTGERKDPLKLDQAGRRKATLEAVHKSLEERQQRDA